MLQNQIQQQTQQQLLQNQTTEHDPETDPSNQPSNNQGAMGTTPVTVLAFPQDKQSVGSEKNLNSLLPTTSTSGQTVTPTMSTVELPIAEFEQGSFTFWF